MPSQSTTLSRTTYEAMSSLLRETLLSLKLINTFVLHKKVEDFKDTEEHHRHMSHLFGLYPGHSLTIQTTPDLCEAGAQSMIKRGMYSLEFAALSLLLEVDLNPITFTLLVSLRSCLL